MPPSHGDIAVHRNLIGVVDDPVHDGVRNRIPLFRIRRDPDIPFVRIVLRTEDGGTSREIRSGTPALRAAKAVEKSRREGTSGLCHCGSAP